MACVRKRRVGKGLRWVLDYRDQQGRRHWETTKGNRKEAERLLADRVREISRGTYRRPAERVSFEDLAQKFLKDIEPNVRFTTFKDYRCNLNLHLLPYLSGWKVRDIRRTHVEDRGAADREQVPRASRADVPLRHAPRMDRGEPRGRHQAPRKLAP
jgi:Phage integrase, N-terminal SAM-like domain